MTANEAIEAAKNVYKEHGLTPFHSGEIYSLANLMMLEDLTAVMASVVDVLSREKGSLARQ